VFKGGAGQSESHLPAPFNSLLTAWSAGQAADGMRFAALPLLALVTDRNPAAVGAVAAATALPWLCVALPAGILADRLSPSKVIAGANIFRALVALALVAAILTGKVSILGLGVVGFALTCAETFADSAAQTVLVRIVPPAQLERANARFVSFENAGVDLIGPLLSGGLFFLAEWLPFAVCAVLFILAAVITVSLTGLPIESVNHPAPLSAGEAAGADPAAKSTVRGAFMVIFMDPVLRPLVVTVAVLAATVGAMEGVLVVYSTESLQLSKALFPTLLACYSVGLLVFAGVVPGIVRRFRSGVVMLGAIVGVAVTLTVLGAFPRPLVAWACFLVMGAAGGFWNILSATRRQRRTPRHLVGAVSSAFRTIAWGAVPIGTAVGGLLAAKWGVNTVFELGGVTLFVLAIAVTRSFLRPDALSAGTGNDMLAGPDSDMIAPASS